MNKKHSLILLFSTFSLVVSAVTNDTAETVDSSDLLLDIVQLVDTGATVSAKVELPSLDEVVTQKVDAVDNQTFITDVNSTSNLIKQMDESIKTGLTTSLDAASSAPNASTNLPGTSGAFDDSKTMADLQSLLREDEDDGYIHTNVYVTIRECIEQGLEKNLGLTIDSYNPSIAKENIRLSKSVFDPEIYGAMVWSGAENPRPYEKYYVTGDSKVVVGNRQTWQSDYSLGMRGKTIVGASWDVSGSITQSRTKGGRGDLYSPYFGSSIDASLKIPLLKGFGIDVNLAPVRIARNDWRISKEILSESVQNIVNDIIRSYYTLYYYRENADALEYTLKLAYELRAINEAKVQVGMAAPLEITKANAQIARDEETLIIAKNDILNAEDNLRFIINYNMNLLFRPKAYRKYKYHLVPLEKPKVYDLELDEPALIDVALKKREAVEIAKLQFDNSKLGMVIAKNNLLPEFNAFGTLGFKGIGGNHGNAADDLGSASHPNWSAGMDFSIPIFYNQPIATYRRAKYTNRKAEINVELVKQQIIIEVRTAIRSVKTNRKRISATLEGTRLAREQLFAEQEKYDVGQSTTFEVLQYQDDLASALTSEISALAEWRVSVSDLARVTGSILDVHSIVIDDFYNRPSAEAKPFISDYLWR